MTDDCKYRDNDITIHVESTAVLQQPFDLRSNAASKILVDFRPYTETGNAVVENFNYPLRNDAKRGS